MPLAHIKSIIPLDKFYLRLGKIIIAERVLRHIVIWASHTWRWRCAKMLGADSAFQVLQKDACSHLDNSIQ
jgi:hypothetical protein